MFRSIQVVCILAVTGTALSTSAWAQSGAAGDATTPGSAVVSAPTTPSPQQFLDTAKQSLDAVSNKSLDRDGQKKLGQLRDDMAMLSKRYQLHLPLVPIDISQSNETHPAESPSDATSWRLKFDDVERDFVSILGGGSNLPVPSTTAVGTPVLSAATVQPGSTSSAASQSAAPGTSPITPAGSITAAAPRTGTPSGSASVTQLSTTPNPGVNATIGLDRSDWSGRRGRRAHRRQES